MIGRFRRKFWTPAGRLLKPDARNRAHIDGREYGGRLSYVHNAAPDRNSHCARSVAYLQFFEEILEMSMYCLVTNPEELGDLFVSLSVSDQLQDLLFTSGERRF